MTEPLLVVTVEPAAVELIADALLAAGASAVEERPTDDGRVVLLSDARVTAMSDVARLPGVVGAIEARAITDDGLDGWRLFARPERAGERIVVRPAWVAGLVDPRADDVELIIDPGRAFGSGSHATTRLALAALEQLVDASSTVLDVGCGSGVLAIACARLGALDVLAVDIDPAAHAATSANALANHVDDRVRVDDRVLDDLDVTCSIVVANITAAVLRDLAPALIASVRPGGTLVVTGMLDAQLDDVLAAFSACQVQEVTTDDGWACAALTP